MLLLNYVISVLVFPISFRGHATIWRNADNEIVKTVIYDESTRMKPKFADEAAMLNALPAGWEYEASAIPQIEKLLYRKKRKL